jgi:Uma2 family endonuclease
MSDVPTKPATYADLEAVPEHLVAEIIDGALVTHPRPAPRHSLTFIALTDQLTGPFQFDEDGPGGWVFLAEPELLLGGNIVVPDLAAWRSERMPSTPDTATISVPPNWVCEILSASTETRDRTVKMRVYAEARIPHLWLIDPRQQILQAFELREGHWTVLGGWSAQDVVRAPPFDAIAFPVAKLWPLDRPLGFNEDPQPLYAGDR